MSFFPSALVSAPDTSFHPLFRLLDDFDQYSRGGSSGTPQQHARAGGRHLKSFTPKFDVKELADSYELHGEFPGLGQENVEIEFVDAQTLTVKGRVERSYTAGTPPSGRIEDGDAGSKGAITEKGEKASHKATVEDANEGADQAAKDTDTQVVAAHDAQTEAQAPRAKYWVSERSVGEFSRSFTFPVRIDQDAVTASMKNGVLSIVVPKSKKAEGRKIEIS